MKEWGENCVRKQLSLWPFLFWWWKRSLSALSPVIKVANHGQRQDEEENGGHDHHQKGHLSLIGILSRWVNWCQVSVQYFWWYLIWNVAPGGVLDVFFRLRMGEIVDSGVNGPRDGVDDGEGPQGGDKDEGAHVLRVGGEEQRVANGQISIIRERKVYFKSKYLSRRHLLKFLLDGNFSMGSLTQFHASVCLPFSSHKDLS